MNLISNYPLMAAIIAIVLAQVIKVPLHFLSNRKWDMSLMFSSGGMPSSHSAAVTSLSYAVGVVNGFNSSLFAISAVISTIVMYDAAGVRRHAGEQAAVLNQLVREFDQMFQNLKTLTIKPPNEQRQILKELLGHRPSEVFMGAIFGIVTSMIIYYSIYR